MKINPIMMMKAMKKMMLFKAAMAALLSFAVFACTPVEPEGNGGENPGGENPGGGEPDTPTVVERSIKLYNADAEVETLVFAADATTYELTVKANFQWDLDKDATTWPAWLKKLTASETGVLNETSELYEGTVTLVLNVENISSYYENKTGNLVFTDVEDLEYAYEFPVSHTFEKPVEPESILSNALGTNILTVTTDGKIKGADSNTLEVTITPGEGEADFKAFLAARTAFDQDIFQDGNITTQYEWKAAGTGNYNPKAWATIAQKEGNVYTLTINNYPEEYTPANATYSIKTVKGFLFVLPSSVYGTWFAPFPGVDDPAKDVWWMAAGGSLMDKYAEDGVFDAYKKYVITLNVEQPAE